MESVTARLTCLFVATLSCAALHAQDLTTLRGLHGFGNPTALAIDSSGTRAYVGETAALSILDLSAPAVPLPQSALLSRFSVDASILHLELDEAQQRLLIAGGSFGVSSIDLSAATYPHTTHDDPGDLVCFDLVLTPSHVLAVFGAVDASELRIYDRATLALIGTAALGTGTAFAVDLEATHAYVAMGIGGIKRVDVSNPAAPLVQAGPVFPVDVFNEPARARDVVVSNGHLYVAADGLGLVEVSTSVPWTPTTPYATFGLTGPALGGGTATLYAHRVDAVGLHVYVGANKKAGREADGGPYTTYGPMNYLLAVGGVKTPPPLAVDWSLIVFQQGGAAFTQVNQVAVPSPWRGLVARATRIYHVNGGTGTFVRDAADPTLLLSSYVGALTHPAEALLSLRDPNLVLSGQDGVGANFIGLLDISNPDEVTPVAGTAGLASFGLWFDAQWLDDQPTREWFVGSGNDNWRLVRFDANQPSAPTHWKLPSPDDPDPGFNNGRNYFLSWLDGDLLLLTRGGTAWGLVGFSRSALEAEAAVRAPGTALTTPPLWQVKTHPTGDSESSQTWRCRTFSLPSGQRVAAIAAGFHTQPGPDESRPLVVLYDISAGTTAPPTLLSSILGPNLEGNAMAVATAKIGSVTYLFVVDFGYGMHVYDVSDPTAPSLVGGWAAPLSVFDGLVDHPMDLELVPDASTGSLSAYVTSWRRGLVHLDVTNPATFNPPVLAEVDTPGTPYGIAIRDVAGSRGLVLADHIAGLRLYGHYAKWAAIGGGCTAAAPSLAVTNAPVLGGTFALHVEGLGTGSAFMVTGLAQIALPLQPLGHGFGAGCTLLVAPDVIEPLSTSAGAAAWSVAIPPSPALRGRQLYNQVAELGVTSVLSNAGVGTLD